MKNNETDKKSGELQKELAAKKAAKVSKQKIEAENFKRKYFDYYDDVKISVKEDW